MAIGFTELSEPPLGGLQSLADGTGLVHFPVAVAKRDGGIFYLPHGEHRSLGPGTLYGSIKRMIDQGLVEETDERPDPALDDQRRRYYRLSTLGQRVGAAEQARLAALLNAAQLRHLGLAGLT